MKILEFKKLGWFVISLILIGVAALSFFLNHLAYNRHLELTKDYVEVDCIVTQVDDINRTITVAYVYDNTEYYASFQTIEYEVMDSFVGVIKPEDPTKLRFNNGYSFWNGYTYFAITLLGLALLIDLVIVKRLLVRLFTLDANKGSIAVVKVLCWKNLHLLVVEYEGKKYMSEIFRTFQNINVLEENARVDFLKRGPFYHIDLKTYHKQR